jgi:hypothetical protein
VHASCTGLLLLLLVVVPSSLLTKGHRQQKQEESACKQQVNAEPCAWWPCAECLLLGMPPCPGAALAAWLHHNRRHYCTCEGPGRSLNTHST